MADLTKSEFIDIMVTALSHRSAMKECNYSASEVEPECRAKSENRNEN